MDYDNRTLLGVAKHDNKSSTAAIIEAAMKVGKNNEFYHSINTGMNEKQEEENEEIYHDDSILSSTTITTATMIDSNLSRHGNLYEKNVGQYVPMDIEELF